MLGRITESDDRGWWDRQLAATPAPYLEKTGLDQILDDFRRLQRLSPGDVAVQASYVPDANTVEYKVGTYEQITPGVFHKLCGALASQGLQILSAEINTLADGLIFDRFWVLDPDFSDEPPAGRLAEVERAVVNSLKSSDDSRPAFRRVLRRAGSHAP